MIDIVSEPVPKEGFLVDGTPFQMSEEFFNRSVGINQATIISRASKSQISRDSNAETLPFSSNEKGQKRYKVADLYQKYGFRKQQGTGSGASMEPRSKTRKNSKTTLLEPPENTGQSLQSDIERAILQTELKAKEELIRRMEDEIRDLRQKQDKQLDTIQSLSRLLPAPKNSQVSPAPQPEKKSMWKRLFP
jgi:hypothetical protein